MHADYDIYVRGSLGPEMRHALADLCPHVLGAQTQLSAYDIDQGQLHGILWRLRTLALEIDAVWRTDADTIAGLLGQARTEKGTGDSPESPTWPIATIEGSD